MHGRIDIYINQNFKPSFEQLQAQANIEGIKLSTKIGQAIEFYLREIGNDPKLIADESLWGYILDNCKKDDLLYFNTLLNKLNQRIMIKLCNKRS